MWFAAVLITLVAAPLATPEQRVLVLSLTSSGVEPTLTKNLSEVFASSVRKHLPGTTVFGQDDIDRTLAVEKQRDLLGCVDNVSCLAEIGGALGADLLAVGSVGKVGAVYLLTLKVIRARDATTLAHVAEQVASEEELIEATLQWSAQLVDPEVKAPVGFAEIGGDGKVTSDGVDLGSAPLHRLPMTPGVHNIIWTQASGSVRRNVVIEPYRLTRVLPEEEHAVFVAAVGPPPDARRGWTASAGAGTYAILLGGNEEQMFGLVTAAVDGGYTMQNGWMLGGTFHMARGSEPGLDLSTWAVGARAGPLSSGRLTIAPTLAVGVARVNTSGEKTGLMSAAATLPYGEAAFAVRYGVWKQLSIGLQASYFIKPPFGGSSSGGSNYTEHIGAAARLFVEGHSESDFSGKVYDGPGYWWIGWGLGVAAIVAVNLFAGGGGDPGGINLGTVVVK